MCVGGRIFSAVIDIQNRAHRILSLGNSNLVRNIGLNNLHELHNKLHNYNVREIVISATKEKQLKLCRNSKTAEMGSF